MFVLQKYCIDLLRSTQTIPLYWSQMTTKLCTGIGRVFVLVVIFRCNEIQHFPIDCYFLETTWRGKWKVKRMYYLSTFCINQRDITLYIHLPLYWSQMTTKLCTGIGRVFVKCYQRSIYRVMSLWYKMWICSIILSKKYLQSNVLWYKMQISSFMLSGKWKVKRMYYLSTFCINQRDITLYIHLWEHKTAYLHLVSKDITL
jgi:hypothetical protein